MDEADRKRLLSLARETVRAVARGDRLPEPAGEMRGERVGGVFVTLRSGGKLRGCMGRFLPEGPLDRVVVAVAASAARDPRFEHDPIRPEEVDGLSIDISLLSMPQRTQDPLSLKPGVHGVWIRRGERSGCFLPQVAVEAGWDARQFLENCCVMKAHLPPDAWQDPETEVYLFTSEVLHEGGQEGGGEGAAGSGRPGRGAEGA